MKVRITPIEDKSSTTEECWSHAEMDTYCPASHIIDFYEGDNCIFSFSLCEECMRSLTDSLVEGTPFAVSKEAVDKAMKHLMTSFVVIGDECYIKLNLDWKYFKEYFIEEMNYEI